MKKFLYLMLLPLMAFAVSSCDDDDKNLPDVNLSIQYSGATESDGALFVEQGQTFTVDALIVTPAEGSKKATLGQTIYYLDGVPFYSTVVEPFAVEINTTGLNLGEHSLGVRTTVYQVDKEIGFALTTFKFMVTQPTSSDDNGSDDNAGTLSPKVRMTDGD